jgi:hypothetical protein
MQIKPPFVRVTNDGTYPDMNDGETRTVVSMAIKSVHAGNYLIGSKRRLLCPGYKAKCSGKSCGSATAFRFTLKAPVSRHGNPI